MVLVVFVILCTAAMSMVSLAKDKESKDKPQVIPNETKKMTQIRQYLAAFAGAAYQNPKSICPQHQMMLPRIIKG